MTSYVPNLDDRTFEELVDEARGLIPEIAPEWTDHNIHDQGITIIELIAFLVEQQIYRVGYVGPSLRRAFTRLMGIMPRDAEPARFDIWPLPARPVASLDLPDRYVLHTPDLDGGQFMLDGATRLVSASIKALRRIDTDGTVKSLGLGLIERRSPLLIRAPLAGGPQFIEVDIEKPIVAAGGGPISLGVLVADGPFRTPGSPAWDPIVLEQKVGDAWQPLEVIDRTEGLTRSGTLRFVPENTGDSSTLRLRLDRDFRPASVKLTALGLNVLAAVEGADEPGSVVGDDTNAGNALPNQSFAFETRSIVGGVSALSFTGPGPSMGSSAEWSVVESFENSSPLDAHVVIDAEAGTLTVGNGLNGRRLPLHGQLLHGPLTRTSGAEGNIPKGLHWTLQGHPFGENIEPGQGGRDADKLDDLIARARAASSARAAHLSAAAIKTFLEQTGLGLARIEVLTQKRPGAMASGSRTVWIVPDRGPQTRPPKVPQQDIVDAAAEALDPARLLGERIYVSTPIYLDVDVELSVVAERDADIAGIEAELALMISGRLWDLPRHPKIDPWTPGQSLSSGDIRALVAKLPHVVRLESCTIHPADGRGNEDGKIALSERECVLLRNLSLDVKGEGEQ